ncbi:MAG: DUF3795 domain-containing protein [bacterium]
MEERLSYCGYRCDLCPAYVENLKTDEDRERVSRDWAKYYDHHEDPADVDCKGCKAGLEEGNTTCKVRPCAIERGASTCAECGDFACDVLQKQMDAIKPIAQRHAGTMPPEDFERYVAPYKSEERLRNLRP